MKVLLSIVAVCFILLASPVLADFKAKNNELGFGGDNADKKKEFTDGIILENTHNTATIEDIKVEVTKQNGFPGNIDVGNLPNNIGPGGDSDSISIKIEPGAFDIIDNDFEKRGKITIGTLKFKGVEKEGENSKNVTTDVDLTLELENSLKIDNIEIEDEDDNKKDINEGSTYTVTEDEDLKFTFKLESTFSDGGLKLEEITIKITSDDLDIDEEESLSELDADDTAEVEIDKVSSDTVDKGEVIVEVEGEDEFGGKHGKKFTFKLDVEEKEEDTNNDPDPDEDEKDDSDGDSIDDANDLCPNTVSKCTVDTDGCPVDSDDDGICDALDPTPRGDQKKTEEKVQERSPPSNRITAAEENKNKEQQGEDEPEDDTSSLIPFLIGFFVGIGLTAGFFMMIKN